MCKACAIRSLSAADKNTTDWENNKEKWFILAYGSGGLGLRDFI